MLNIFREIDESAKALLALQPMKEEYKKKLDRKFRLEFNYNSNHMEGNTLTYGHTELLLIFDQVTGDYKGREIEEMKAHDVALAMVKELAADKERDLTENFIRQLNEIILVRPFYKEAISPSGQPIQKLIEPGNYKKTPNSVLLSNGEMFDYASPEETAPMMNDLIDFYRSHSNEHPVWQAAMLHYKFVRIHPFDDGNGRTARLLMNYVLFKHDLPPVIIKSSGKKEYIAALNKADTNDLEAFVTYIAEQELWSLGISIRAAKGESIDEAGDLDKEIVVFKKELSKEDVLKNPVSVNCILQAFEENIFPILITFEEKCEGLKDLFFDFDRRINYKPGAYETYLGTKESSWNFIKETLLNRIKNENHKVTEFKYEYTLKGFKKNINAPSFTIRMEIHLNEFNYVFTCGTKPERFAFAYEKKLSEKEMSDVYAPLIREIMEDIKRFSK